MPNIYSQYSQKKILKRVENLSFDDQFTNNIALLLSAYREKLSIDTSKNALALFRMSFLKNEGIEKRLGFGNYAYTYLGIDGFVYKMNVTEEDADSWVHYAKESLKNSNPFFPIIYEIKIYDDSYCCKMERLEKIKTTIKDDKFFFNLDELIYSGKVKKAVEHLNTVTTVDYKTFQKWSRKIHKIISKEKNIYLDIHSENIMQRGEQWVITDPVS